MDLLADTWPPHVEAAYSALHGPRPRHDCGRPTRTDRPCWQPRPRLLPSCRIHATPDELATAEAERARLTAILDDWYASQTPACHRWPLNDQCQRDAEAVDLDDSQGGARVLWTWQQGLCAICGHHATRLDHDHTTGLVRGWLCRPCNTAEARLDGGEFVKYRHRPPAVMLGLRARYVDAFWGAAEPGGGSIGW